jgi:FtsH-binding integral membrane protein
MEDARSLAWEQGLPRVEVRPLLRNAYLWMVGGLLLTALAAWITLNVDAVRDLTDSSLIVLGAVIAELILVFTLSAAIQRLSASAAMGIFIVYALLNGFTLSFIFVYYDWGEITSAFVTAAALFAVMAIVGTTTSVDLTRFGPYLYIGLIGIMIALLVNIFIGSSTFDLVISIVGVILFTALTAYDAQKIARMASDPRIAAGGEGLMTKLSILGALSLYLDFINLFLFLLRIFGRRR